MKSVPLVWVSATRDCWYAFRSDNQHLKHSWMILPYHGAYRFEDGSDAPVMFETLDLAKSHAQKQYDKLEASHFGVPARLL